MAAIDIDITQATHCVQVSWPIVDETLRRSELLAQALPKLKRFAASCGAEIVGEPVWRISPGSEVLGWWHWPGLVLTGTVPVDPPPSAAWLGIDTVAVARACDGQKVKLGRAERLAAIVSLTRSGHSAREIADRIGCCTRTVTRTRTRMAGVSCTTG